MMDDVQESGQANQKVHFRALKKTCLCEVSKDERDDKKLAWLPISSGVVGNTDKMGVHWRCSGRNSLCWFHDSKREREEMHWKADACVGHQ